MDEKVKQWLAQAKEQFEKRDFSEAERYLQQILAVQKDFADVHHMIGVIQHDRGEFHAARDSFNHALSLNPKYTEAALNLAVTLNDLGEYDEAKDVYDAAMERMAPSSGIMDPFIKGRIANLHAQVAQAYAGVQWYKEATAELRKAVGLCPQFPDLRLQLAHLLRDSGDIEGARTELEAVVEAKPDYVEAQTALGVVYLQLGYKDAAIVQWKKVLDLQPTYKPAQMYLRVTQASDIAAKNSDTVR